MKVDGKDYRTVWFQDGKLKLIEQNLLPFRFEIFESDDYRKSAQAIKNMAVRGAGAIGATAGFAMAQVFIQGEKSDEGRKLIESTRPTAKDLFYATERVYKAGKKFGEEAALKEAQKIAEEYVEAGRKIGEFGEKLIADGAKIATHCNAGWLAFVDWGSALAPVYAAHRKGRKVFVWVDETRPRGQGARLSAWELQKEGVPHTIIPDNAAASLMQKGEIDMFIVGADRVAANGDFANKIGTLEKAICAKEYGIPFYVAAPLSTFDLSIKNGDEIPIEERSQDEVLYQTGTDEKEEIRKVRVCSPGSSAYNPAFDVTPANLVKGIITEKGIIKAENTAIEGLLK